jgi:hypothetical protein
VRGIKTDELSGSGIEELSTNGEPTNQSKENMEKITATGP